MTMKIDIKEQYLDKFEDFINSLPKNAVVVKKSLDDEINEIGDRGQVMNCHFFYKRTFFANFLNSF